MNRWTRFPRAFLLPGVIRVRGVIRGLGVVRTLGVLGMVGLLGVLGVLGVFGNLGCRSALRVKGSAPAAPRPSFEEVQLQKRPYQVWVLVPRLKVNVYPMKGRTQQPMIQFTGDREGLVRGRGQVAMLVAPDRYRDGDEVTFFEDRVLWADRLRESDGRTFTLWLRENNRSAPTRHDEELRKVDRLAEVLEGLAGIGGFKVPARRAIRVTLRAVKELQRDWLILRWTCTWRHVLEAAREAGLGQPGKDTLVLRTRLHSLERVQGQRVAEVTVLFVIRKETSGAELPERPQPTAPDTIPLDTTPPGHPRQNAIK